jgi:hypothetical protein
MGANRSNPVDSRKSSERVSGTNGPEGDAPPAVPGIEGDTKSTGETPTGPPSAEPGVLELGHAGPALDGGGASDLAADNGYSPPTCIDAGTVQLGVVEASLPAEYLDVPSAGTLDLTGSSIESGTVQLGVIEAPLPGEYLDVPSGGTLELGGGTLMQGPVVPLYWAPDLGEWDGALPEWEQGLEAVFPAAAAAPALAATADPGGSPPAEDAYCGGITMTQEQWEKLMGRRRRRRGRGGKAA